MKCAAERRSLPSRVVRLLMRPATIVIAAVLVMTGWSLVLFAAPMAVPTDFEHHVEFVLYLGGALLVFIGCSAGMVSWVVTPVVDRRFAQHILHGATDHKDLLSAADYNRRHEEIVQKLSRIEGALTMGVEDRGRKKERS